MSNLIILYIGVLSRKAKLIEVNIGEIFKSRQNFLKQDTKIIYLKKKEQVIHWI